MPVEAQWDTGLALSIKLAWLFRSDLSRHLSQESVIAKQERPEQQDTFCTHLTSPHHTAQRKSAVNSRLQLTPINSACPLHIVVVTLRSHPQQKATAAERPRLSPWLSKVPNWLAWPTSPSAPCSTRSDRPPPASPPRLHRRCPAQPLLFPPLYRHQHPIRHQRRPAEVVMQAAMATAIVVEAQALRHCCSL